MDGPQGGTPRAPRDRLGALLALWPYLRNHRALAAGWIVCLFAAAGVTLALPLVARAIIDHGFASRDLATINTIFLAGVALALVLAAATAGRYYCITLLGERAITSLREILYGHLLRLDIAFYDDSRVGDLISRLGTDTTVVLTLLGSSVSVALRNVVVLVGAVALMLWTSPKLTGLAALVIPGVLAPIFFYARRLTRLSRANQDRLADASAIANETLNAARAVKAYSREPIEHARYTTAVRRALTAAQSRITASAILTGGVIALVFVAVAAVLWVGTRLALEGHMDLGLLSQFLLYAMFAANAVGTLGDTWGSVLRAAGSMGRISELLDARPMITNPATPMPLPQPARGALAFEHVTFRYPSTPDAPNSPVLQDFNLKIQPGETVALVGPSGAGKSTVFNLLLRFHDPVLGRITLDGVDLRALRLDDLRGSLALVPQETAIFSDSASNNIRFGRTDADDVAVRAAASTAEAAAFLDAQPNGFETLLGEHGVRLSGGQRQRVAIARAVLRNAPVLLLDEATSSLDAMSERAIMGALDQLMGRGRTTLIIAHRLATVKRADRIIVMDRGNIVASGTHDSLLREGGMYAQLARMQFAAA